MRSFIYLAVSTFAAVVAAQSPNPFNVPGDGYDFTSGEPTTLKWNPTTEGTITLKLQVGKDITPDSGEIIAENIPNSGTYSFVPPQDAQPNTQYTVEIIDDNDPDNYNFTPTFTIDGSSPQSSATTSAEMTTSATSEVSTMTSTDATTTADTTASTETDAETTTTDASATGTESTMSTSRATESASGTGTETESGTGTSTAEPTVQTTTAPGAGVSLKVHGGMFALVAGVMAAL